MPLRAIVFLLHVHASQDLEHGSCREESVAIRAVLYRKRVHCARLIVWCLKCRKLHLRATL